MRQNEWLISGIVVCGLLQPMTVSAESASVPAWAYESLQQLVDEGYADMPAKDIRSCSREELAQLTAQALKNTERHQRETVSEGAGKTDLKNLSDEIIWTHQKTVNDSPVYERAERQARRDTEVMVRYSILGNNHLEKMSALKKKEVASRDTLRSVAHDYAQNRLKIMQKKEAGIDTGEQERLIDVYSQGAIIVVNDEVQLRLAQEQEKTIRKQYLHSKKADVANLKGKVSASQEKVQRLYQKLAQARTRTLYWKRAYLDTVAHQHELVSDTTNTSVSVVRENRPMDAQATASKLRAEFLSELVANGYIDDEAAELQLYSNESVKCISIPRLKVDGEVRIDSGHSTSSESVGNRTRIRARVYPDYDIDGNWHAKGMVEAEKVLSGDTGNNDGKVRLDRYYLEGNIGIVKADIGVFGSNMAEGNVYDSRFKGIRLLAGTPVRYQCEFGSLDNIDRAYNLTASYDEPGDGWDGGYYHFNSINGTQRNIYMLNWRRRLSLFDFGLMLLHGKDDVAGDGNGYVITLSHGLENNWRPRNVAYWLKYYRQPSATYVEHTMNGMADYMNYDAAPTGYRHRGGFRGLGLGYNYTINTNLSMELQYYSLWDLETNVHSNTIWGALTFYFKNYKE